MKILNSIIRLTQLIEKTYSEHRGCVLFLSSLLMKRYRAGLKNSALQMQQVVIPLYVPPLKVAFTKSITPHTLQKNKVKRPRIGAQLS